MNHSLPSYFRIPLIIGCLIVSVALQAQPPQKMDAIDKKVEALLQKMTLEEKVGQMNQYNGFWEITGPVPKEGNAKMKYEHLKKGLVGAVLNVKGTENVRKLQEIVVKQTRLGIPLLFGFDVIHGHKTLFPIPLAEACSWDLDLMEKSAHIAAVEASAVGINWTFAPMLDITRDPRWGRVMEGAGEDPFLGAKIGVARVKGFQGNSLAGTSSIAATAKHFAGYGFAEGGRDYNTVDVGTSTLYNIILPPFKAAVDNDVKTVMNSFNVLNGIPATGNKFLQRDILKDKWGFKGFVISDWGSGAEMVDHGFAKDLKDAAAISANAGSDMDMESYAYVTHLKELVEQGKVPIKYVNDAVKRILRVKYELGLFDNPYKYCDSIREKTFIYHPDHIKAALETAKKSIVLLKNDNHLLPLAKTQQNIAVIGALANDKNSPLGSWRIGSDDNSAVDVLTGLKSIYPNITFEKGVEVVNGATDFLHEININTTDSSLFDNAVQLAQKSSVVIMVLGEHGFQSGEGRSRANLGLPGLQQQLLERVYAVNKNIVVVLMNGRPLVLPWMAAHIPAIVEAWQLGTQTGNAVASVLFGDYNPSGKLTMTFPKNVGQIPLYYNHYNTGRPGPKPAVFWSHYSDESYQPLYPFGYGLSYTSFGYSALTVSPLKNHTVEVTTTITNTGSYAGEEIAQLYLHQKVGSVVRPVKALKGFQKIALNPKESKTIRFLLTDKELGFYDNNGNFIVEKGAFDIMVGGNSQEGLEGHFTLE